MAATRAAASALEIENEPDRPHLRVISEVEYAPLSAVRKFVKSTPLEYLECREMGHPWGKHTAKRVRGGFERTLRCPRCGGEKHQTLDRRAHPVGPARVDYPEGYLNTGCGRIDSDGRDLIRLTSVTRSLTD